MDSVILKLHEDLKNNVITSEELVNIAIEKAEKDETNSFVTICDTPKPPEVDQKWSTFFVYALYYQGL